MERNINIKKEILNVENNWIEKDNSKNILNQIFNSLKWFLNRFNKNKEKVKFLIPIAIILTIFMIYMIIKTTITIKNLNRESSELHNLKFFNTKLLENSDYTKEDINNIETISDLINYELEISKDTERYNKYLSTLQSPYSYLMRHIFLPQINIWKDPFMWDIDISIIWAKFLEKNPYNDIKLIQKWSDFFKNVWNNNEFNEIEDILIWDIIEDEESFHIPIKIKFISNSKRSFLLLVEKLSTTSNQKNISLINEFVYNLRENIKKEKNEVVEELMKNYDWKFDKNETIWYHIYQRIFENQNNKLIDDKLIDQTISDTIVCWDEKINYCFYKFRDKYRSIPSLAYTIWLDDSKDKTNELKKFLKELPPIIKINEFTFERNMQQNIKNYENIQYKWEIQMNIYGRWIAMIEVNEIAENLWNKCIWAILSPTEALKIINNTLVNLWDISQSNNYNTSNLRELKTIIENIEKEYWNLTNYNKVIRLFEVYRMLQDWNLCSS